jgi:cell division septal protein FtsQ
MARCAVHIARARKCLRSGQDAARIPAVGEPMWWQRKTKNRAFERRQVLDVRLARRQAVRTRVRVATLAASLSLGTVFALYLLWHAGLWGLDRLVYENRTFAIEEIDIQTDGVIVIEQLRRWAGVKRGQNLFALDLTRVKRDLELVPAIQSVAVERVLPHTLRIRVVEREPIAQIHGCLIDTEGFVMLPLAARQRSAPAQPGERYPVITGAVPADVPLGKPVESLQIRAALKFLQSFDRSAMAVVTDIARVDVSAPAVLHLVTSQQNEIIVPAVEFEKHLNRWRLVYEAGLDQSRQIGSLDLSVADNVPLRWLETAALPPVTPKVKKKSPYKKKHV